MCDKRDVFDFDIVNLSFSDDEVLRATYNGVFIS